MATSTRRWTRADLADLPDDGNRYEVLDGKLLVTPQAGPHHQWIAAELMAALREYCARHSLGVVVGPAAVVFGGNKLQPDVEVIPCAPDERQVTVVRPEAPDVIVTDVVRWLPSGANEPLEIPLRTILR